MLTTCRIACVDNHLDDTVVSSNCHYFGSVEHTGTNLYKYFNNYYEAHSLASSGDFSSLVSSKGIIGVESLTHYEEKPVPTISKNENELLELFKENEEDYLYFFDEKWFVYQNIWNMEEEEIQTVFLGSLEKLV